MSRYGIVSDRMSGVSASDLRAIAKELGPDHAIALEVWETGWHEARMLVVSVFRSPFLNVRDGPCTDREAAHGSLTGTDAS